MVGMWVFSGQSLQNMPAKEERVRPPVRALGRVQGLLSTGAQRFGECLPQAGTRQTQHQARGRGEQGVSTGREAALAQIGAPGKDPKGGRGRPPVGAALSWDPSGALPRGRGLLGCPRSSAWERVTCPWGKAVLAAHTHEALGRVFENRRAEPRAPAGSGPLSLCLPR